MFLLPHGTWKDNIRSIIFDWRLRSAGCSREGGRSVGLLNERRDPLVTPADLSAQCVCSPAVTLHHKKGPRHRRKICVNYFSLCSYNTQSTPSNNKNIDYIFIYTSPSLFVRQFDMRHQTPWCSSYWKGNVWVAFDSSRPTTYVYESLNVFVSVRDFM